MGGMSLLSSVLDADGSRPGTGGSENGCKPEIHFVDRFYLFPNANDITRRWLKSQLYLPSFSSGTLTKRYCINGGGGGTGGQADMGSTGASKSSG